MTPPSRRRPQRRAALQSGVVPWVLVAPWSSFVGLSTRGVHATVVSSPETPTTTTTAAAATETTHTDDAAAAKGLSRQIAIKAGWLSFGTSFADEDVPTDFAPDDPEGEQIASLKESLGSDVFGALAGMTGLDQRPSSLSKDGAKEAQHVRVRGFKIDATTVSNEQFKKFVRDTKFETEAEKFRWSFVLEPLASAETIKQADGPNGLGRVGSSPWWLGVWGATWRKPEGPDSTVRGRANHPAVHISWNDATAYCAWAGRRLPTEREWELAARGGLEDEPFPWGADDHDLHARLNQWEGAYPEENLRKDGYVGTAPVDAYAPNGLGIYNMLGNVWEWCDGGTPDARPLRGGSYVDTVDGSHNHALRVSTRMDQSADSGGPNTGFRCAADLDDDASSSSRARQKKKKTSRAGATQSSTAEL